MERLVPAESSGSHARTMRWDFVWPADANPYSSLECHYGQPLECRLGWDIFGYRRNTWIDGADHAWDRFGFRMYAAWARSYTMAGLVISMFRPGRSHCVVCEVANEDTAIDVYGVRILATVRALQHWASRWRRGLRVLRQRRARMVLALTLPQAPEIITHVLMYL